MNDNIENNKDDLVFAGYLLDDGNIADLNMIEKARSSKASSSNRLDIDEDEFGEAYSSGLVYRPTINLQNLKSFSLENTYHSSCIKQIADDCCSGIQIVKLDKYGNEIADKDNKRSKQDNILNEFINDCSVNFLGPSVHCNFTEMAKIILSDYLTFGWTGIEMTRTKVGKPKRFYHLPVETIRIARNLNDYMDTDQKFLVQVVNTHERIFKIYDQVTKTLIEPHTKGVMTEAICLRNYHVDGGKYGVPNWFPSIKAMVGNDKVAEYNITFFNNEAVPRFAVLVTGGKIDENTKKTIKNYFKKDLKGSANAHKTLVLTGPKGTEIKLVPLANDVKDGSFRLYRKDNRDEIIHAHKVPPHRLQILDAGASGTLSGATIFKLDKVYKESVVKPLQNKLADMFNAIIKTGLGIKDRCIRFNDLDIGEDSNKAETLKTMASAHEKYYAIGSMTTDDIRKDLKLESYSNIFTKEEEKDIRDWARIPRPVYLIRQAQQEAMAGLNGNTFSGNINETSNEFDDKSKEQTQGNTQFSDEQINQLMMKRAVVTKVLKELDEELQQSIQLNKEE